MAGKHLTRLQSVSLTEMRFYLHRCDGAFLGGGDSLLHGTHVSGQSGLVTHSRGDTPQQGGHLRRKRTCHYSGRQSAFAAVDALKKKKHNASVV